MMPYDFGMFRYGALKKGTGDLYSGWGMRVFNGIVGRGLGGVSKGLR